MASTSASRSELEELRATPAGLTSGDSAARQLTNARYQIHTLEQQLTGAKNTAAKERATLEKALAEARQDSASWEDLCLRMQAFLVESELWQEFTDWDKEVRQPAPDGTTDDEKRPEADIPF